MDRRQIALRLTLQALGLKPAMDTFEDRLIVQKAVYLVQVASVHLGYYHCWYLRGPYCRELADDAFAVASDFRMGSDEVEGWALDVRSLNRLKRFRPLIEDGDRKELARKLELLASVHFLVARRQVPSAEPKVIGDRLRRFGKLFSETDVREALGELRRYGIHPGSANQ
jgi:hypothetical protein